MERKKLREILKQSKVYKSDSGIRAVLNGGRNISLSALVFAFKNFNVSPEIWLDIKKYLDK